MSRRRFDYPQAAILLLLVVLHFVVPGFLGDPRFAPDFLLLALLIYAIKARPGRAAVAGFMVGLVADSLTPAAFGAGALAYTLVGYLAAWAKTVFFAEYILVNAAIIFAGVWIRDLVVLIAGRPADDAVMLWQLVLWSPIKALITAAAGAVTMSVFRRWLNMRILE